MDTEMNDEPKNTLLIVDDDISNLMVLTNILGSDYIIYTAKNGANAIEKAVEYTPDLILLDIIMPKMDGYVVLAELKKLEATKKIPVIFITGLNSSEDEEVGLSLNASDYISKPLKPMIVKLRVRNQIQIVNQLRTIEHLSMIDQLTGIHNRRSFDAQIQSEWKRAIREEVSVSVLIIDIDRFKAYNDAYGHQQGDVALRTLAQGFSKPLKRASDFAARWGGEEFIVLLPRTTLEGALDIAEEIRRNVENTEIPHEDGSGSKLTISIGVTSQDPKQNSLMDPFISMADQALYDAKAAGRNRVAYRLPE